MEKIGKKRCSARRLLGQNLLTQNATGLEGFLLRATALRKELKKLDKQVIPRILQAVENLAENPYSLDSKKLVGSDSIYLSYSRWKLSNYLQY